MGCDYSRISVGLLVANSDTTQLPCKDYEISLLVASVLMKKLPVIFLQTRSLSLRFSQLGLHSSEDSNVSIKAPSYP